jgi:hypothetical protein
MGEDFMVKDSFVKRGRWLQKKMQMPHTKAPRHEGFGEWLRAGASDLCAFVPLCENCKALEK